MISRVERAIEFAENGITKLTDEAFGVPGFSSRKCRIFLNTLCDAPGTKYLEVGTWYGSTLVGAGYKNKGNFTGIDNFSQFQKSNDGEDFEVAKKLEKNLSILKNSGAGVEFIEADFTKFTPTGKIDVFFYDGDHAVEPTKTGLEYFKPHLSKEAVVIVDDVELTTSVLEGIKSGTKGWEIVQEWHLPMSAGYHMGLWVAVVKNG